MLEVPKEPSGLAEWLLNEEAVSEGWALPLLWQLQGGDSAVARTSYHHENSFDRFVECREVNRAAWAFFCVVFFFTGVCLE